MSTPADAAQAIDDYARELRKAIAETCRYEVRVGFARVAAGGAFAPAADENDAGIQAQARRFVWKLQSACGHMTPHEQWLLSELALSRYMRVRPVSYRMKPYAEPADAIREAIVLFSSGARVPAGEPPQEPESTDTQRDQSTPAGSCEPQQAGEAAISITATAVQPSHYTTLRKEDTPQPDTPSTTEGEPHMAARTKMTAKNVQVVSEGKQIILPEAMTIDEAIIWLDRKRTELQTVRAVRSEIHCFPLDGAYALHRAIAELFGWTNMIPTPGFWSDNPPQMIDIPISPTERVQVPWGRIVFPGIEGYLETSMAVGPPPRFVLTGEVRTKDLPKIEEIVTATQRWVRESSIYRGQAIRVSFEWQRQDQRFSPIEHAPKFLDFSHVREEELIFGPLVESAIRVGLWAPIQHSDACRAADIPLKRGVLLEGRYGVGKTLTAYVTAKKAVQNGWTFVYLESVEDLAQAVAFAKQYSPAVLFAEDVDRVVKGERDMDIDAILNTLDGVDAKDNEIIVVLTTNDVEAIHPSLLRPGRLDILVSVEPPDAVAAERLIRLYGRTMIAPDTDLSEAAQALAGNIPAVIRETVERAKIATIDRVLSSGVYQTFDSFENQVTGDDIVTAAQMMSMHLQLLEPKEKATRTNAERVADIVGEKLIEGMVRSAARIQRYDLGDATSNQHVALAERIAAEENGS